MAELLFIATTVFVAYVLFSVVGDKKNKPTENKSETKAATPPPPVTAVEQAAPEPVAVKAKPAPTAKKSKAAPAPIASNPSDSLKNPKTGEVAKLPGNYAFAKRWIKDALVEEGLLDKVYKNAELDDATNAKIQAALLQLKALEKYQ